MSAYYNEIDPFASEWLRKLIANGLICPGDVDTRSIVDVRPDDLRGYTQCHFFAGIGVWSYALRQAGWSDDQEAWTGSCPCQPFSAAGKGAGFDDERHLWPSWFHLIESCQPVRVFGEQVASSDGLAWLDLVQSDLEGAGYTSGAVDLCAAGVGAPHIRQRLWFMAYAESSGGWKHPGAVYGETRTGIRGSEGEDEWRTFRDTGRTGDSRSDDLMGFTNCTGSQSGRKGSQTTRYGSPTDAAGGSGIMADADATEFSQLPDGQRKTADQRPANGSSIDGMEYAVRLGPQKPFDLSRGQPTSESESGPERINTVRPNPTNGFWRDADWLGCRDGKWRPVEPGTFPLAHGAAARVGRLRGYGNAINAQAAVAFIEAAMSVMP